MLGVLGTSLPASNAQVAPEVRHRRDAPATRANVDLQALRSRGRDLTLGAFLLAPLRNMSTNTTGYRFPVRATAALLGAAFALVAVVLALGGTVQAQLQTDHLAADLHIT